MIAGATNQAQKPPLKRSLFNRPAWSRPQNIGSAEEIFHRSSSSYADLAAETERKRKAKLARKNTEQAKDEIDNDGGGKRRRLSSDSEEDSDQSSASSKHHAQRTSSKEEKFRTRPAKHEEQKAEQRNVETTRHSSPASISKRYGYLSNASISATQPKSCATDIIDLEDESDDASSSAKDGNHASTQPKETVPPDDDDFPASDDEYAELARKAREKARTKRLEDDLVSVIKKPSSSAEPESHPRRSLSAQRPTSPSAVSDPEIYILVTSAIENTKPLIIKRKLSQRLKDVRITWCQHQQFTPDMTSTIFLTWRGKRLFDVTSCKSLGIAVDAEGNVTTKGLEDMFGDEEKKIHMEAMTEELLEQYRKTKKRRTEEPELEEEQAPELHKPQEAQVRIILKAKGFDDFKLIVKPSTSVSRIIKAFRQANPERTEGKEVYLVFDGDRLELETHVGTTELSDMDHIDVYVK
ncbi:MAG: hypothetical protein Q9191_006329 [Dirinaria sp. TL-2023a]